MLDIRAVPYNDAVNYLALNNQPISGNYKSYIF